MTEQEQEATEAQFGAPEIGSTWSGKLPRGHKAQVRPEDKDELAR